MDVLDPTTFGSTKGSPQSEDNNGNNPRDRDPVCGSTEKIMSVDEEGPSGRGNQGGMAMK